MPLARPHNIPVEVTVESLGGLGDGIASLNGKPLFIAKSCTGDRLEVQITQEKSDKYHGTITRVISAGPERQEPLCRHFSQCGGCTLQQLSPNAYHAFKTRMLHGALAQAGFPSPTAEVVFLPAHTRRRVECKISRADGKLALAFHSLRSHTAVEISECPVLHPELEKHILPLGEALSTFPFAEYLFAVSLTKADVGTDLLLAFKGMDIHTLPPLNALAQSLGFSRICVQLYDEKPHIHCELSAPEMNLGGFATGLPPDAFLQATQEGQQLLTECVIEATQQCRSVADLFCGIGTYSFPLSQNITTYAIEGDQAMVQAMRQGISRHKIKTLTCEQRDLMLRPLSGKELTAFDGVVINPPRIGAKAQCEQLAPSEVGVIAMVSCNPATFARDAAILKKGGYKLESARGIDQFLWSQHLEIVAVFRR